MKFSYTIKLTLFGALFGVALLLHPADSQAEISENTANQMADDSWQVYNHGYNTGVCDPKQTNLQPESRLYLLLQAYFAYCDLGVIDRKTGNRQSAANFRGTALKTIEWMNQNERKKPQQK